MSRDKTELRNLRAGLELLTDNSTWDYIDRLSDVRRFAKLLLAGVEAEEALRQASKGVELTPTTKQR